MRTLSFTVSQRKQKVKFSDGKKKLLYVLTVILALLVSVSLCAIISIGNIEYLNQLNKPSFFIHPIIYAIISALIFIITAPSLYLSFWYERNLKINLALSFGSLLINVLFFAAIFILKNTALSTLLILSNFVICCYYYKQLNPKALATYLYIPYLVWLIYNVIMAYSIYLLN